MRTLSSAGWSLALSAVMAAALVHPSHALVAPRGQEAVVAVGAAPRTHRATRWSRPGALDARGLPGWTALWDRDTEVPLRLWGPGVLAPGAVRDPALAEAAARRFLSAHLALLAPGAVLADLVLVTNQLGAAGDVRSVGFVQHAGGVRVLGGAIGVTFKADRVVMVSSTALPDVPVAAAPPARDAASIGSAATAWLAAAGYPVRVTSAPTRVLLPLVPTRRAGSAPVAVRLVDQVTVEAIGQAGRWDVWLDAVTGRPVARRSTLMFASGRVLFDVPDRSPSGTRTPRPAPRATHQVNSVATLSDEGGTITWAEGTATVTPGLTGPLVRVINEAGSLLAETLSLADAADLVWSRPTDETGDAQLSAFVFASTAKAYAKANFAPDLAWLERQLAVSVNEPDACNAYSTGDDIHFYRQRVSNTPGTLSCANTGRLADVVYHEFGHSLHANSIIEGVGQFDGALSEGMSDMFAAFITQDAGMGRGFFFSDAPLRNLDPAVDKRWPDDTTGEVHDDGEIIGGTLWDLRTALIASLGASEGDARARLIFYGILQRASDIPSSYLEALVADDDDGDITNGTPNLCAINAAFGAHGLADPQLSLGLRPPVLDGLALSVTATPPASTAACPGPAVASVVATWKPRGGAAAELPLVIGGTADTYTVELPAQPTGTVLQYQVTVTLADGTRVRFPNNAADPFYEAYIGEVEPVWCASFEDGAADWTLGGSPSARNEWAAGAPQGLAGDPKVAFGGTSVLGTDLATDGMYERSTSQVAESPVIDLADLPAGANVRLQYRRWLGVEDGFFDGARVLANGTEVWASYASASEEGATVHHVDREWRFQDVDLTAQAAAGSVRLRFDLASDPGFELGGWNLDDVCVVIAKPAPACEADGTCDGAGDDGGCCSAGTRPEGALALGLATLGLVLGRRRRRR